MDDASLNVEIGKRLRRFRESLKIPRTRFALTVGFSSESMASYESGRVPLPYAVYVQVMKFFPVDPIWLATGEGTPDWNITLDLPDAVKLGVRKTARFIDVFNDHLADILCDSTPFMGTAHLDVEWRQTHEDFVLDAIEECYTRLPTDRIKPITQLLLDTLKKAIEESPDDDAKAVLKRKLFKKRRELLELEMTNQKGAKAFAERIRSKIAAEKNILTEAATSATNEFVQNQWHRLKQRIQKITGDSVGGKSALAKFLGVDLTQLSKWLTDSKSAREPGADYALKMLHWVQERESQQ